MSGNQDRDLEDDFPNVQKPTDVFADVVFDLMYDASRRVMHEYALRLDTDPTAMRHLVAVREEREAVPSDDVAAWKRKRVDFNMRWQVLRDGRVERE